MRRLDRLIDEELGLYLKQQKEKMPGKDQLSQSIHLALRTNVLWILERKQMSAEK